MNAEFATLLSSIGGAAIGAFLGFIWQTKGDKRKDKRQVFQTLMAYRGVGAFEHDWIKALNLIDTVFYGNKRIKELRREYFTHLYEPLYSTRQHERILLDLLVEMAKDSGYGNIKQTEIMDYYSPNSLRAIYGLEDDKGVLSPTSPDDNLSTKRD